MSFIDELDHELRKASRRRTRLALARVPRAPVGVATVILTLAICAAVAVPVLQARTHASGQSVGGGGARRAAPSVVRTCADTVSGRLPSDWHRQRHGTVITGPITWLYLLANGHQIGRRFRYPEGLAVVNPGRAVTVTVPSSERGRLSLDYTSVDPSGPYHGVSSVTFKPCPGRAGQTQFDGRFFVARPQCAELYIKPAHESTGVSFVPFGRKCAAAPPPPLLIKLVLDGNGIGPAKFGESPKTVARQLTAVLRRRPSKPFRRASACKINGEIAWPGLEAYFHDGRFVGYAYFRRGRREPELATAKNLYLGDTLKTGRHIYGSKFHVSAAQGGSWWVETSTGRLEGFTSRVTNLNGKIVSIEAGDVGCPAMTP